MGNEETGKGKRREKERKETEKGTIWKEMKEKGERKRRGKEGNGEEIDEEK